MFQMFFVFLSFFFISVPSFVLAEESTWTPLISASDFDGIRVDVTTACVGIISILVMIVAVALLKRAFTS